MQNLECREKLCAWDSNGRVLNANDSEDNEEPISEAYQVVEKTPDGEEGEKHEDGRDASFGYLSSSPDWPCRTRKIS